MGSRARPPASWNESNWIARYSHLDSRFQRTHRSRKRAKLWILKSSHTITDHRHHRQLCPLRWGASKKEFNQPPYQPSNWIQLDCAPYEQLTLKFDNNLTVRLFLHPTRFGRSELCVISAVSVWFTWLWMYPRDQPVCVRVPVQLGQCKWCSLCRNRV